MISFKGDDAANFMSVLTVEFLCRHCDGTFSRTISFSFYFTKKTNSSLIRREKWATLLYNLR